MFDLAQAETLDGREVTRVEHDLAALHFLLPGGPADDDEIEREALGWIRGLDPGACIISTLHDAWMAEMSEASAGLAAAVKARVDSEAATRRVPDASNLFNTKRVVVKNGRMAGHEEVRGESGLSWDEVTPRVMSLLPLVLHVGTLRKVRQIERNCPRGSFVLYRSEARKWARGGREVGADELKPYLEDDPGCPFSLSFNTSVLAGYVSDPTSCTFRLMTSSQPAEPNLSNMYVYVARGFDPEVLHVPPVSAVAAVRASNDEFWHPRTKLFRAEADCGSGYNGIYSDDGTVPEYMYSSLGRQEFLERFRAAMRGTTYYYGGARASGGRSAWAALLLSAAAAAVCVASSVAPG